MFMHMLNQDKMAIGVNVRRLAPLKPQRGNHSPLHVTDTGTRRSRIVVVKNGTEEQVVGTVYTYSKADRSVIPTVG